MIKILIIFILLTYLLGKLSAWLVVTTRRPTRQQSRQGEIHIDSMPKKHNKEQRLFGGEYVDFEDVK